MSLIVLIDQLTKLLCIFVPIGLAILLVVLLIILLTVKKRRSGTVVRVKEADEGIYTYLGGRENIKSYSLNGSRLTLELVDQSKIDKDGLKKEGVSRVLEMSNKVILVGEVIPSLTKLLGK